MAEPLKNMYDLPFIERLAVALRGAYPSFQTDEFRNSVFDVQWKNRELKARMRHITLTLQHYLPGNYLEDLDILLTIAPGFHGFPAMIFPDYVEVFGLEFWEPSVSALKFFTQLCSSEFAVRAFIKKDQSTMMDQLLVWSNDENEHVRRLSSEGCRPRLPWAMQLPALIQDPGPILPILENLKSDESLYVRTSVANNLNDISKDHPHLVLNIADSWGIAAPHIRWILKRGLRTLLKMGNQTALTFFSFEKPDFIKLTKFQLSQNKIHIGESITFVVQFVSRKNKPVRLRIEYALEYITSSNKRTRKIFQIGEKEYHTEIITIKKKHSFANQSTRKHYPGRHSLTVIINGVEFGTRNIYLTADK